MKPLILPTYIMAQTESSFKFSWTWDYVLHTTWSSTSSAKQASMGLAMIILVLWHFNTHPCRHSSLQFVHLYEFFFFLKDVISWIVPQKLKLTLVSTMVLSGAYKMQAELIYCNCTAIPFVTPVVVSCWSCIYAHLFPVVY